MAGDVESSAGSTDRGDDTGPGWRRFQRAGTVTAHRLESDWTWQTSNGATLHGRRGDWLVEDASGGVRTVTDGRFRETHRHLGEDRWQRTAVLEARPARPGESAVSLEGTSTAVAGDWIVRDAPDNAWVVPGDHFIESYSPES